MNSHSKLEVAPHNGVVLRALARTTSGIDARAPIMALNADIGIILEMQGRDFRLFRAVTDGKKVKIYSDQMENKINTVASIDPDSTLAVLFAYLISQDTVTALAGKSLIATFSVHKSPILTQYKTRSHQRWRFWKLNNELATYARERYAVFQDGTFAHVISLPVALNKNQCQELVEYVLTIERPSERWRFYMEYTNNVGRLTETPERV